MSFLQAIKQHQTISALVFFAILVAVFYGNTLGNGFVHDDIWEVANNPNIQSISGIVNSFTTCFLGDCERTAQYRPMKSLSFVLTWQMSSAPWIFHLMNLVYYWGVCVLLFRFVLLLAKDQFIAFLTALFFLIHPIHSEVVSWIALVPDLLVTIFLLLAFIFYIQYWNNRVRDPGNAELGNRNLQFVFLWYFLGMLSKEPMVFLPLALLCFDIFVRRIKPYAFFTLYECKRYIIFCALFVLFFILRGLVLGNFIKLQSFYDFTFLERIYAFFTLFAQYIFKAFVPYPLLAFYSFEQKVDFLSFAFGASLLTFILFVCAGILLWKKGMAMHVVFILWFFIFLSPSLIFLNSLGENIFAERYLLIPSISIAFFVASATSYAMRWFQKYARFTPLVFVAVLTGISFAIVTPQSNVWHDNRIFFTKTLAQNPGAHALRYDYALLLYEEDRDFGAALKEFKEIVHRNPDWYAIGAVYGNIGDIYKIEGDDGNALAYFHKAIDAKKSDPKTLFSAGTIYAKQEDYLRAVQYFCRAYAALPKNQNIKDAFDKANEILKNSNKENFEMFHAQFFSSGAFIKEEAARIVRFESKECTEKHCLFFFDVEPDSLQIFLPHVFLAQYRDGAPLNINTSSINVARSMLAVDLSPSHAKTDITFLFPACEGTYYEATTSNE